MGLVRLLFCKGLCDEPGDDGEVLAFVVGGEEDGVFVLGGRHDGSLLCESARMGKFEVRTAGCC